MSRATVRNTSLLSYGTVLWLRLLWCLGELYTEAADEAMAAMKGRLANQYYMKAEEAWAEVEEW